MKGCGRKFLIGRKEIRTITTDLETGEKRYTYNHGYYKICGQIFCGGVHFCPECKINDALQNKEGVKEKRNV